MSRIIVTESELLAEIKRSSQIDEDAPPEAMTITELARAAGVSSALIQRRVAELKAAGRIKAYRVNRYDGQDRPHRATAYVLLPAAPAPAAPAPKRKRA